MEKILHDFLAACQQNALSYTLRRLMLAEISTVRKCKISLQDYNYKHDIENRLLLAEFSTTDVEVLEEILYSSLHIPIKDLLNNLDLTEDTLFPILKKLSGTGLFSFNTHEILVDKENRKYFEAQLAKFDPDFKPNMEFIQGILRKVPIHILPSWYAIPRTSNNIFDSVIEKYLLTPHIFERHLSDVASSDPLVAQIIDEVYSSPDFKVFADALAQKFHLSQEQLEEILLSLEFHFICCLSYVQEGAHWKEVVTPFYEWKEYLTFLNQKKIPSIPSSEKIQRFRPRDFAFVEDAYRILASAKKKPLRLEPSVLQTLSTQIGGFQPTDPLFAQYVTRILSKLKQLEFIQEQEGIFSAVATADEWLDLPSEERAMFLYRHPLSHDPQKHWREAEKSIIPVVGSGFVYFDAFIQGVRTPLSIASTIKLEKHGKTWKYHLPEYTAEEIDLIKTTVFDFLFEVGVTAIGTHEGKECFAVTPFGKSVFS